MCNRKLFAFNHSRLGNLAGANLRGLACLREATVCLRSLQDMDREYQRKYSKFHMCTYVLQNSYSPNKIQNLEMQVEPFFHLKSKLLKGAVRASPKICTTENAILQTTLLPLQETRSSRAKVVL